MHSRTWPPIQQSRTHAWSGDCITGVCTPHNNNPNANTNFNPQRTTDLRLSRKYSYAVHHSFVIQTCGVLRLHLTSQQTNTQQQLTIICVVLLGRWDAQHRSSRQIWMEENQWEGIAEYRSVACNALLAVNVHERARCSRQEGSFTVCAPPKAKKSPEGPPQSSLCARIG
jgi:hypothetical protein